MEQPKPGPLLSQIDTPDELRKLARQQLRQVCDELRQFIVDQVSTFGGHFGAGLGVVELTVALHYAYNTPYDQLVWDIGHQAYGHKILTGRRDRFHTNRRKDGLSGFPKRSESAYDAFGVGHSSTSISAALGMALAARQKGELGRQHVAIIGDGALTSGLAFEGMNHAGASDTNLLIVLNDNNMAIDENVGALNKYLTHLSASSAYNRLKQDLGGLLGKLPYPEVHKDLAAKVQSGLKGLVSKSSHFFESLGLRYFGVLDGHDVLELVDVFRKLKDVPGPKILHVRTVKGKGYALAEEDQVRWHAPGLFDKISGKLHQSAQADDDKAKYQDVFGHTVLELARQNPLVMGITPAMPSGSSLKIMMDALPGRALDVGIAEQHAVTLSAGLATQGMKVFCTVYSTFLQRAFDSVIHDVALQNLPVIFCVDRAGLVGEDGATHHGAFDIAYMRLVPNMIVSAPMDEGELRNLMFTAQLPEVQQPFSIRYPRGKGLLRDWKTPFEKIGVGTGRKIRDGRDLAILSFGHPGNFVVDACHMLEALGIQAAHYDLRFAKPLDEALLHEICARFERILTVEDGTVVGGFGSAVLEFLNTHSYQKAVRVLGIPDEFIDHARPDEQYESCGFDAAGIVRAAEGLVGS